MALEPVKFRTWGRHYLVGLPIMLRLERRSNFRDLCLQDFGKDAGGSEGLFETLSNEAELVFAQLKPPEPSIVPRARDTAPRATYHSMPDEFMRGGGCFAHWCCVQALLADGTQVPRKAAEVQAGDTLRVEGGSGWARVRCVVTSRCPAGIAELCCVGKLQITPWHPLLARGAWHFPAVCVSPSLVRCSHVVNFVLETDHVLMVEGVPCVTLGHGIEAPVAAHPFWGTAAVLDELRARDPEGWAAGCVVLNEPLRA